MVITNLSANVLLESSLGHKTQCINECPLINCSGTSVTQRQDLEELNSQRRHGGSLCCDQTRLWWAGRCGEEEDRSRWWKRTDGVVRCEVNVLVLWWTGCPPLASNDAGRQSHVLMWLSAVTVNRNDTASVCPLVTKIIVKMWSREQDPACPVCCSQTATETYSNRRNLAIL